MTLIFSSWRPSSFTIIQFVSVIPLFCDNHHMACTIIEYFIAGDLL